LTATRCPPKPLTPTSRDPPLRTSLNYSSCFTWPAIGCDSYWDNTQGVGYNGTNPLAGTARLTCPEAALALSLIFTRIACTAP